MATARAMGKNQDEIDATIPGMAEATGVSIG